jgi:membrane-bound ClpP family serine protease
MKLQEQTKRKLLIGLGIVMFIAGLSILAMTNCDDLYAKYSKDVFCGLYGLVIILLVIGGFDIAIATYLKDSRRHRVAPTMPTATVLPPAA